MKRIVSLTLTILFPFLVFSQHSVTFEVTPDLKKGWYPRPPEPLDQVVFHAMGEELEDCYEGPEKICTASYHPFMEAMQWSFSMHVGFTISPDMVWLLIVQGFANHVSENADVLRDSFVDFEGKKVLTVFRDQFTKGSRDNDWEGVFPEFTQQIAKETGPEVLDELVPEFSTTGVAEKAAFEISMMDAMSEYFIYTVLTRCGIPEVKLEGTEEDWAKLIEHTKALAKYDLHDWVGQMIPHLEKIHESSKGNVDQAFWQSMYKYQSGSGGERIDGWITSFFPYLRNKRGLLRRTDWSESITTSDFTTGMSKADFYWMYHGKTLQMVFAAGFVGFQYDDDTVMMRPEIGWAIGDKKKEEIKAEDVESATKYSESQNDGGKNVEKLMGSD